MSARAKKCGVCERAVQGVCSLCIRCERAMADARRAGGSLSWAHAIRAARIARRAERRRWRARWSARHDRLDALITRLIERRAAETAPSRAAITETVEALLRVLAEVGEARP